jgi:O-antigen ligase
LASRLLYAYQFGAVHSGLLQLLVEQGILGFGMLMLAFVMIWKRLGRVQREDPDPGHRFLAWFLMWGLVTEVVNSIATHPWQHAQHWLIVSLAVAFLAYVNRQPSLEAG